MSTRKRLRHFFKFLFISKDTSKMELLEIINEIYLIAYPKEDSYFDMEKIREWELSSKREQKVKKNEERN